MNDTKEIILNTEPNIVEYRTNIEGWVGKDGRFYGKDKDQAIYGNSTHKKCDEGHIYRKSWINCPDCEEAKKPSKYLQLDFKEWDSETPLCLFDDDKYFFAIDDIEDYLDTEDLNPEDLQLVICKPNYLWEIQTDYWEDVYPEDRDLEDVASKELISKINELNELIRKESAVSWKAGKFRTNYLRK